jgi:hypothetical protein
MEHVAKTPMPAPAGPSAARPTARRVAGPAFVDNSAHGAALRHVTQLMQNGPVAVAQRRAWSDLFGTRAKSLADPAGSAPQQPIQRVGQDAPSPAVIQRQESLAQKIVRILGKRNITVTAEDAARYAAALEAADENTLVPVAGRNRALKVNRRGIVSSVAWRPPSDASKMRVSPENGPMAEDESSMVTEGPRPLTGAVATQDVTIDAAALDDIPDRENLGSVMGGSASQLSAITNSEWLHMVAHSLGGSDTPANLGAGPHSLNTAMIPFERVVRVAARTGTVVDYRVTFFSDVEGSANYVHHVQLDIAFQGGQSGSWTLEVNRDRIGQFINGQVLNDIERIVEVFARSGPSSVSSGPSSSSSSSAQGGSSSPSPSPSDDSKV